MKQSVRCPSTESFGARMRFAVSVVALVCMSWQPAVADEGALHLHGFATQGFVHTTDNRFFGDSDDGSFDFTEIGLNLSYRATPSLLFSGQLLSRSTGDMYDGSPIVDFAHLDWRIGSTEHHAYGLMLGRMKRPLGLYNDTRDVAFTRPGIFLPQQVYFDAVRNLVLFSDGVHVYAHRYLDAGTWSFVLGLSDNPVDENVEYQYLGADFPGDLDSKGLSWVGRVDFESADGVWKLALSGSTATFDYTAGPGGVLGSGDIGLLYWVASMQYNAENWSLTAEYMEEPAEYDDFGPLVDERDTTVQGYYVQGSYLLRHDVELMVRYGAGYASKDDHAGRRLSVAVLNAPSHLFYQKDITVGVRWDVTPNLMLRAEHQWARGSWGLAARENPDLEERAKNWNMFSLLASYRF